MFSFLRSSLVAGGGCLALLSLSTQVHGGALEQVNSFGIPRSPSGMFYDDETDLLYVLCGTQTNGDHYLYAVTPDGESLCEITIPDAAGMSRVDGFYICLLYTSPSPRD